DLAPELLAALVVGPDEDVALPKAPLGQATEARFDQRCADPLAPKCRGDSKVVQVAPAAVVTAQQRADDLPSHPGHEAQSRVALQEGGDTLPGVRLAQAHPLRHLP